MSSTKRKAPPVRIARPQTTQSAKHASRAAVNEARTTVVHVNKHQPASAKKAASEAIEISSDESDADADAENDDPMDEDEDEDERLAAAPAPATATAEDAAPTTNGHAANGTKTAHDDEADDARASPDEGDDDDDDDNSRHEPTFGELVREHETVDVAAALRLQNPDAAAAADSADTAADAAAAAAAAVTTRSGAAVPTLASLGHLLNAALRAGDDANLEVCFNTTTDAVWIRNTIRRLDPALAGALLQKLAARIHRRPGRAHTLVGWVQWTLITHGGALLANQAGVTRALQELHRVLEERARGLNSLLLLKGKLDMLEAQMQMRRLQRAGSAPAHTAGVATVGSRVGSKAVDSVNHLGRARGAGRRRGGSGLGHGAREAEDEEQDVVTYEEDLDADDADASGQILVGAGIAGESFVADSDEEALDDDDDDDDDNDGDDSAEDEEDDDDNLEEMDDDDAASEDDEVDFDDVDEDDEDDDEDDEDDQAAAAPPPKLQKKAGGAFSKRR